MVVRAVDQDFINIIIGGGIRQIFLMAGHNAEAVNSRRIGFSAYYPAIAAVGGITNASPSATSFSA
jgi:hypothetical protein